MSVVPKTTFANTNTPCFQSQPDPYITINHGQGFEDQNPDTWIDLYTSDVITYQKGLITTININGSPGSYIDGILPNIEFRILCLDQFGNDLFQTNQYGFVQSYALTDYPYFTTNISIPLVASTPLGNTPTECLIKVQYKYNGTPFARYRGGFSVKGWVQTF